MDKDKVTTSGILDRSLQGRNPKPFIELLPRIGETAFHPLTIDTFASNEMPSVPMGAYIRYGEKPEAMVFVDRYGLVDPRRMKRYFFSQKAGGLLVRNTEDGLLYDGSDDREWQGLELKQIEPLIQFEAGTFGRMVTLVKRFDSQTPLQLGRLSVVQPPVRVSKMWPYQSGEKVEPVPIEITDQSPYAVVDVRASDVGEIHISEGDFHELVDFGGHSNQIMLMGESFVTNPMIQLDTAVLLQRSGQGLEALITPNLYDRNPRHHVTPDLYANGGIIIAHLDEALLFGQHNTSLKVRVSLHSID